jgi:putative oxidoreductase
MMNKLLWVLQVLLALAFVAHGVMFLNPPPDIATLMNASLPKWFQLFLGVAEVLAGIGLTVPGVTRVQPVLVPAAAVGIAIVAISATIWHLMRREYSSAVTTALLLAVSSFVAFMRWRRLPIVPRVQQV